jgi:putative MATE family efflux protein
VSLIATYALPDGGETHATWQLAWPAIARMFLVTLVFMADRALVGHYDSRALASMQISTTLTYSACSLFGAIAIGTTALVARMWGAGKRADAATAARVALLLAALVGTLVAAPMALASDALLAAVFPGVGADVIRDASAYLVIVMPVLPLALVEMVAAACLQASGDTRSPLYAATLANVINLPLSAALVFGVGTLAPMGVRGAALGSAVAFGLQALLLLVALFRRDARLCLRTARAGKRAVRRHLRMLARLWRVALPALGERFASQGGYLAYVAIIATLGTSAMAANQALISIEAFSHATAEGFGVAAAALVGQRLGAGRERDALSALASAVAMATVALTGFALVFVAAPSMLLAVFSSDPAIGAAGRSALSIAAFAQPIMAIAVVGSMALRGAGATKRVLWITMIAGVAVRLSATWLFAVHLDMGLTGVWLGSTADWIVQAALIAGALSVRRLGRVPV